MLQKINFEKSLKRLEEITDQLESGELSLDDSLKLFEEGIKLSRLCENKLTEAEQKIEILKSMDVNDYTEDELKNIKNNEEIPINEKKKSSKKKIEKTDNIKNLNNSGEKESFLF